LPTDLHRFTTPNLGTGIDIRLHDKHFSWRWHGGSVVVFFFLFNNRTWNGDQTIQLYQKGFAARKYHLVLILRVGNGDNVTRRSQSTNVIRYLGVRIQ
jgi:hypothetical protein